MFVVDHLKKIELLFAHICITSELLPLIKKIDVSWIALKKVNMATAFVKYVYRSYEINLFQRHQIFGEKSTASF